MKAWTSGMWGLVVLAGCGGGVSTAAHRDALAEQRAAYEGRLAHATRAAARCADEAARAAAAAADRLAAARTRIERLERAAAGPAGREPPARLQAEASDWFDAGGTRLRPGAEAALDGWAPQLTTTPQSVLVRVGLATAAGVDAAALWREAAARGAEIAEALRARGVAAGRITLAVSGGPPFGRIEIGLEGRAGPRRRSAALDSDGAGRQTGP